MATKMKRSTFWATIATVTTILALIGGTFWYGNYYETVLKPQQEAEALEKANVSACEVFQTALAKASAQSDIYLAFNDLIRGAKKALEQYDPEGTSMKETFGPEYDEFLTLGKMEFAIEALGPDAYATVSEQVQIIQGGCSHVLDVKANPSASPTN